jgi:hypothetical protein
MTAAVVFAHVVDVFLRLTSKLREVIAAYPDRLVIARFHPKIVLPPDVYRPDGAAVLLDLPQYDRPLTVGWDEVNWVECHRADVPIPRTTFRLSAGGLRRRWALPAAEAEPLVAAFRDRLGGRLHETADSAAKSHRVVAIRATIALLFWLGATAWLVLTLWSIVPGAKPPHNAKVRLLWESLAFLRHRLGPTAGSGVVIVFGLAMGTSSVRFILGQRHQIRPVAEGFPRNGSEI